MKRRDFLKSSAVLGLGYTFLPLIPSAFGSAANYQEYYNLAEDLPNLVTVFETGLIDFGKEEDSRFLVSGWSHTEKGHTWAIGKEAKLVFYTFSPQVEKKVTIKCRPFPKLPEQSIKVFLNGHLLKDILLKKGRNLYEFKMPGEYQKRFRNDIRFIFQSFGSPRGHAGGKGRRRLAVDFNRLTIRPTGYQGIQSGLNELDIIKKDKVKNIAMPINSMVRRRILIKPSTVLELDVKGDPGEKRGLFSVMVEYDGESETIFSFNSNASNKPGKTNIDLSKYSNKIVELRFVYETNDNTYRIRFPSLRLKVALSQRHGKPEIPLPNILFIVVDTLRADHLGCYGGELSTPNVDSLAKKGVLFEDAYCHIPITLPSHASMFTSLYPSQTLVLNNGQRVSRENPMLADLLAACGFRTRAIVSLGTLSRVTHINQGFQAYDDPSKEFGFFKTAEEVNGEMINTIDTLKECKNWFQFLHYTDPHEPYHAHGLRSTPVEICLNSKTIAKIDIAYKSTGTFDVLLQPGRNIVRFNCPRAFVIRRLVWDPKGMRWKTLSGMKKAKAGWRSSENSEIEVYNSGAKTMSVKLSLLMSESLSLKEIRESYQKEVEYVDKNIGEILKSFDEKGLLENTVIIFTADHGEGLGDHKLIGHIEQLYNSLIHIPLIISYPKQLPKGKRIPMRVRHVDILPTILEILGVSADNPFAGKSLMPLIEAKDHADRPVLSMTFKSEALHDLVSLIDNDHKVIKNLDSNTLELYNIKNDPKELRDVSKLNIFKLNRMERKLNMLMEKGGYSSQFDSTKANSIKLDKDQIDKLRGLGYMK